MVSVTRAGLHRPVVAVAEPFHSPSYGPAAPASPICSDSIQTVTEATKRRRLIALSLPRTNEIDAGGHYTLVDRKCRTPASQAACFMALRKALALVVKLEAFT